MNKRRVPWTGGQLASHMIIVALLFFQIGSVIGQNSVEISGTVTDQNGDGLPGTSIVVDGTTTGTVADIDGNYRLNVPQGSTHLVISYIGYLTERIPIGNSTVINTQLKFDKSELDEIIVVGYGVQKKAKTTGSFAQINNESFVNKPFSNVGNALQGRIPGVQITSASGEPGSDDVQIRIRGVGTTNQASPLVLVDGIPSSLSDVSPADIEKVTVLKDAAAAAIYGARGANGVVLITTKRGKGKAGSTVGLSVYTGWQKIANAPEVLGSYDFARLQNEARLIDGVDPADLPWSQEELDGFRNGSDPYKYPNTNWMDEVMQTAAVTNYRVDLSGNNELLNYSISTELYDQEGIIKNTESKRFNFRTNLDAQLTNKLTAGTSIAYNRIDNDGLFTERSAQNLIRTALLYSPTIPVKFADGNWGVSLRENVSQEPDYFVNPVRMTELQDVKETRDRLIGNVYGNYEIISNLNLRVSLGTNLLSRTYHDFLPTFETINPETGEIFQTAATNTVATLDKENATTTYFNQVYTLSYVRQLGADHEVSGLLGYSREQSKYDNVLAHVEDFPGNTVQSLNLGSLNPSVSEVRNQWALESVFGRVGYSFQKKYLFEANFRYDGSSRFLENNRYGFFPSFSAGWIISDENFMSTISFLDQLKLRASWGQLGNEQVSGTNPAVQQISGGQNYVLGDAIAPGVAATALANPQLAWETTTVTNFALDFAFLKRLTLTTEYFVKTTSDLLWRVTVPDYAGRLTAPFKNIGEVENKGFEIDLGYADQIGDFTYGARLNFTHVKNEVTYLDGDELIDGQVIIREGESINSLFGYQVEKIFQSQEEIDSSPDQNPPPLPGNLKFVDQNGDGTIDADDRVIIGNTIPSIYYGFSFDFGFKGFDLNLFFTGVKNKDVYMTRFGRRGFDNNSENLFVEYLDSWSVDNPDAEIYSLGVRSQTDRANSSDYFVQDASYLRFRNIELGYTLPKDLMEKSKVFQSVRFYVSGLNLVTWTDFVGMEVETTNLVSNLSEYPIPRTVTLGANIRF